MPMVAIPGSVLCPVEAYKTMIREVLAASQDPVFVMRTGSGKLKPLLYKQLQEKIIVFTGKTGRDPALYASHSFRRGEGGVGAHGPSRLGCRRISFNIMQTGPVIATVGILLLTLVRSCL